MTATEREIARRQRVAPIPGHTHGYEACNPLRRVRRQAARAFRIQFGRRMTKAERHRLARGLRAKVADQETQP